MTLSCSSCGHSNYARNIFPVSRNSGHGADNIPMYNLRGNPRYAAPRAGRRFDKSNPNYLPAHTSIRFASGRTFFLNNHVSRRVSRKMNEEVYGKIPSPVKLKLNQNLVRSSYAKLVVGEGGMGKVRIATDSNGHVFVVKKHDYSRSSGSAMHADNEYSLSRYLNDDQWSKRHVVEMVDSAIAPGKNKRKKAYFIYEPMAIDMYDLIHLARTTLPIEKKSYITLSLGEKMMRDIQYLHSKHIVHADIKPENFMVNKSLNVKIGDLGLAMYVGPGGYGLQLPSSRGTRGYIAPEAKSGSVQPNFLTDTYALGVSLLNLAENILRRSDHETQHIRLIRKIGEKMTVRHPRSRMSINRALRHVQKYDLSEDKDGYIDRQPDFRR